MFSFFIRCSCHMLKPAAFAAANFSARIKIEKRYWCLFSLPQPSPIDNHKSMTAPFMISVYPQRILLRSRPTNQYLVDVLFSIHSLIFFFLSHSSSQTPGHMSVSLEKVNQLFFNFLTSLFLKVCSAPPPLLH